MQGYARIRTRDDFRPFVMDRDSVFTMEQALDRMRGLLAMRSVGIVGVSSSHRGVSFAQRS